MQSSVLVGHLGLSRGLRGRGDVEPPPCADPCWCLSALTLAWKEEELWGESVVFVHTSKQLIQATHFFIVLVNVMKSCINFLLCIC